MFNMLDPMFLMTGAVEVPLDTWNKRPEPGQLGGKPRYAGDQPESGESSEPRQNTNSN